MRYKNFIVQQTKILELATKKEKTTIKKSFGKKPNNVAKNKINRKDKKKTVKK